MKDANKVTFNQRYLYRHDKIPTEISNTREHPKTLRLAKPNIIFSKGNSNGYGGRMEDKNDRVTDNAQKGCVNANKNLSDHQRRVILIIKTSMVKI